MDESRDETRDDAAGEGAGEHRTTAEAERERTRDAEAAQRERPDFVAGRGRATGEPPLETDEAAGDDEEGRRRSAP